MYLGFANDNKEGLTTHKCIGKYFGTLALTSVDGIALGLLNTD